MKQSNLERINTLIELKSKIECEIDSITDFLIKNISSDEHVKISRMISRRNSLQCDCITIDKKVSNLRKDLPELGDKIHFYEGRINEIGDLF